MTAAQKRAEAAAAERAAISAGYLEAFGRANPGKEKPQLRYEAGWFFMDYAGATHRYRKQQLEEMRDRLVERAAATLPRA